MKNVSCDMISERQSIFIGGKQIGVNCLRRLLERGIIPRLVIPNLNDAGTDTWHESLARIAKENALPILMGKRVKDPDVIRQIRSLNPEIIFCIGGTQIIPPEILKTPKLGCLNIHPALLPKYRGRFSTIHALFNGEKYTGTTLHWMDEGLDSGPIILQKRIEITDTDTGRTLYDKVLTHGGEELFLQFLDRWLSGGKIPSIPQNEAEATYYPKGLPGGGAIDWSWSGPQIERFIRAMTFDPFPPPECTIGGKTMVIVDKQRLHLS